MKTFFSYNRKVHKIMEMQKNYKTQEENQPYNILESCKSHNIHSL